MTAFDSQCFNDPVKSHVYIDSSIASKSILNQQKDQSPSYADFVDTTRPSKYSIDRTAETMTMDHRHEEKRESEQQRPMSYLARIPERSSSSDHKLSDWVIERMRQHESRNGMNPAFNYGISRPMESHYAEYRR